MHPSFHFTPLQILWTFTFAAQLVLLVVLMGRDRIKRFPFFTLAILLMALRLMASRLLYGRMPSVTLSGIFIVMADLAAIVGFLVVVEMARRAFAGARRNVWIAVAAGVLVVGVGVLVAWGRPWPDWKTLKPDSTLGTLRLMQFGAQKLDMLVDLLTVELGLLVSHGTALCGGMAFAYAKDRYWPLDGFDCAVGDSGGWQLIARSAQPHSQAEYERVVGLRDKLFNANGALYVVILIGTWWFGKMSRERRKKRSRRRRT